jgi:diguanylate cyclase (GGDEF)-like protein
MEGSRGWALWSHPRCTIALVFAVVVLGASAATATAFLVPVGAGDLTRFAILLCCALVHLETTTSIERRRRSAGMDTKRPHLDMRSVWHVAGLLLLPPVLVTAMVLVTAAHQWLRVRPGGKVRPPHRVVYSTAAILVANQVTTAILLLAPGPFPGIPAGIAGAALVAVAVTLRWVVNYGLVVAVIMSADPAARTIHTAAPREIQLLEIAANGTAPAVAVMLVHAPALLPLLLAGLVVFHRAVLVHELQDAIRTDEKTGLLNAIAWNQLAARELSRAEREGSSLGVLMLDLDHFAQVNAVHGHPASDDVLRAVATALRAEVRDYDLVARFGGDEFVVALPAVNTEDLRAVGERLRHRISRLAVDLPNSRIRATATGLTASIGVAHYPDAAADTVDALLLAADTACYAAKRAGRNRVELARVPTPSPGGVQVDEL